MKRVNLGKVGSLLRGARLGDVQQPESFQQQFERLLRQELESDPCAQAMQYKGEPYKAETETYMGKILIVNDAPKVGGRLTKWLRQTGYRYALVRSLDEVDDLSEPVDFDTIVHSQEFFFPKKISSSR